MYLYYRVFTQACEKWFGQGFARLLRENTNHGFSIEMLDRPNDLGYVGNNVLPINSHLENLPALLNARKLPYWKKGRADFFYIYGTGYEFFKHQLLRVAKRKGIPKLLIEDGFLRSIDLPVYEAGVSLLLDDVGIYYDARSPSRLERLLNSDRKLTQEEAERANRVMQQIRETKITKYNLAPIYEPAIGRDGVKKVLVIDQAYQDASIPFGLASDESFSNMLQAAIDENPEADIIVKTHPEASRGMRKGYFTELKENDRIHRFTEMICPLSLLEYVDKVYCVTTQMGFEALMCGKEVVCFGMPFYAGWGLTDDRVECPRRQKKRSLEEVFHFAYIEYTRYMDPRTSARCEVEAAIDYLVEKRGLK